MIGHILLMSLRLDSIIIWILLSFLPSKSYSYGIEFDFDTSILTYEYKYHFHLLNQMYGTEVDFDTCILFLMLIRIVLSGHLWISKNSKFPILSFCFQWILNIHTFYFWGVIVSTPSQDFWFFGWAARCVTYEWQNEL